MELTHVGELKLGNKVDITDPCYKKSSKWRMTVDCKPGVYKEYIEISDEGIWGKRVASISIFKGDKVWCFEDITEMQDIGEICVDSGMAGFFNNKPDFTECEWNELCEKVSTGNFWNLFNGFFSSTGFGDGSYTVYANKEHSAFIIAFI